ncbi:PARI protein, partial [Polyodon spathula]|nr:PARI protein [Polyodon spathula]
MQLPTMVKRLICAYLMLLVNSKNDLALAHVLNIPDRGLGRDTFADLKHAAHNTQTSLYLAETSFIRAIQLGGKGYAPSETDSLRKHLTDFVHFTDNLDELLGEIPDPSFAGSRIMSTVKARLLKGRSSEDALCAAAEETVQELRLRIKNIIHSQRNDQCMRHRICNPSPGSPSKVKSKTLDTRKNTIKISLNVQFRAFKLLIILHLMEPDCQGGSSILFAAEILQYSMFLEVIINLYGMHIPGNRDIVKVLKYIFFLQAKGNPIRSQFACMHRDDPLINKKLLQFPSLSQVPTCVHPVPKRPLVPVLCFDDEPSTDTTSITANVTENEALAKPHNKLDCKTGALGKGSKVVAKKMLIAGQGKLTNFLRL